MPKGLIAGKFNERIRLKRVWSCLGLEGNTRNKSASFFCLDMGTRLFLRILLLLNLWITVSPKIFKQILANLFGITKKTTEQMCQVSLKYIELNG